MTPIRPPAFPAAQAAPQASDAVRQAQRAFFEAALGKAQPAPAAVPQAASRPTPSTAVATTPSVRVHAAAQPAPGRILRPGSLIDIKV